MPAMKELPRHIKKLNRKVVRSVLREAASVENELPPFQASRLEARKKVKRQMRSDTLNRTPVHDTPEERNRKMKHRVPIFDRNSAEPKHARPTKKKTPRI
jgi:hypothetical protein